MCKHILFNDFNGDNDLQTLYRFVDKTFDKDGFGLIMRDVNNKIHTFKSIDKTHFHIGLGIMLTRYKVATLVIHHRTSTNGNGVHYAHPFEFQGNYLTHNGVVTVPGKHDTKTTNDSEELLHHLIKTDFETKTVQGYYSCFILNDKETTILVDDTAPMYTNGRTYSSHKLGKKWKRVECKLIRIPVDGSKATIEDIEVAPSNNVGWNQRYRSLGTGYTSTEYTESSTGALTPAFKESDFQRESYGEQDNPMIEFLDIINPEEERRIMECGSYANTLELIKEIAWNIGLELSQHQVEDIAGYYLEREDYTA